MAGIKHRGVSVAYPTEATEQFIHSFNAGDFVDVKEVGRRQRGWSGPHRLLVYKLEPREKKKNPAAYLEIELNGRKFKRRLIVGDQQIIRKHLRGKQRLRVR